MFFLNLTAAEFFTLLGALGGLVTALYLLDRARPRKLVSTLQFWVQAGAPDQHRSRRKMRDPWSLVLQLLSLLFLLLAISRMQWGGHERRGHDHVFLLDTSSWTAAPTASDPAQSVLDGEKKLARRFFSALPPGDRVMLVAASGLATPLTRFTHQQQQLASALDAARPGFSALKVDSILSFAHQAQSLSGGAPGEIVYAGPQLISDNPPQSPCGADALVRAQPPGRALPRSEDCAGENATLKSPDRILQVPADRENSGIRQLSVEQVAGEADTWQALVSVKNYGQRPRVLRLDMRYASTEFAPRRLSLPPGAELSAEYTFTTRVPGELRATITPGGSLLSDDRATLYLPAAKNLHLAVYTSRSQDLRPLLEANHEFQASFFAPSQYSPQPAAGVAAADVIVLDRFAPAAHPRVPSLWIDPPSEGSPLPVKNTATGSLLSWAANAPFDSALPGRKLLVHSANTFHTFEGDDTVASVSEGPVIVVRNATQTHSKSAILGFDPAEGELRFEVATPLLFAGLLHWLDPAAFQTLSLTAGEVGLANVDLDAAEQRSAVRVTGDRGSPIPFSRRGNTVQFFSANPTVVHVISGERERIVSLSLPAVAATMWNVPGVSSTTLPSPVRFAPAAVDLWRWLAVAAALFLLLEWILFGRARHSRRLRPVVTAKSSHTAETEEEFAAK